MTGFLLVHILERVHQQQTLQKLDSALLDEELILLAFSKTDDQSLEWEHDREFSWQGEMYDVKSISETKDSIRIICWKDDLESGIEFDGASWLGNKTPEWPGEANRDSSEPTVRLFLDIPLNSLMHIQSWHVNRMTAGPSIPCPESLGTPPPTPPPDHQA